jgi:hypothetical protein
VTAIRFIENCDFIFIFKRFSGAIRIRKQVLDQKRHAAGWCYFNSGFQWLMPPVDAILGTLWRLDAEARAFQKTNLLARFIEA